MLLSISSFNLVSLFCSSKLPDEIYLLNGENNKSRNWAAPGFFVDYDLKSCNPYKVEVDES